VRGGGAQGGDGQLRAKTARTQCPVVSPAGSTRGSLRWCSWSQGPPPSTGSTHGWCGCSALPPCPTGHCLPAGSRGGGGCQGSVFNATTPQSDGSTHHPNTSDTSANMDGTIIGAATYHLRPKSVVHAALFHNGARQASQVDPGDVHRCRQSGLVQKLDVFGLSTAPIPALHTHASGEGAHK
jgi:hypothetical protein